MSTVAEYSINTVYICVLQDSIILTKKCRYIDLSGVKRWRWAVTVHHDQRIWIGCSLSRSWKHLVSNSFDNVRRVYGRTSPYVVSFSSLKRTLVLVELHCTVCHVVLQDLLPAVFTAPYPYPAIVNFGSFLF
jgi:hypothetical protein